VPGACQAQAASAAIQVDDFSAAEAESAVGSVHLDELVEPDQAVSRRISSTGRTVARIGSLPSMRSSSRVVIVMPSSPIG
jgi:hypothetical protein